MGHGHGIPWRDAEGLGTLVLGKAVCSTVPCSSFLTLAVIVWGPEASGGLAWGPAEGLD